MLPRDEEKGMVQGILLLLGLHVCWILFSGFVIQIFAPPYFFLMLWLYIGAWQYIYVIPTALILSSRRAWGTFKGFVISALLTSLLNGACFLLLFSHP